MEMHQIRYFLAVCESKNFTKAAQLSFVSQPSLTQAIHRLEDEFGGALFSRGRQGAELTSLGRLIEANFRNMYETSLHIKEKAVRFQRLKKSPLRIGVMHSIGTQKLNPFLAKYQKEHPRVELELIVDPEKVLVEKWRNRELECIICPAPKQLDKGVSFQELYEEDYVIALNKNHPLSAKSDIALTDLQNEPYLDRLNCEMREALNEKLKSGGIELYAAYRSNREEWLIDMVREGIGLVIIPRYSVPKTTDILVKPLKTPKLLRTIGILKRQKDTLEKQPREFMKKLLNFFES